MEAASDIQKIAFLGDYLPRKCGIATVTSDVQRGLLRAQTLSWTKTRDKSSAGA
jgi:hypothetical protein